MNKVINKFKRKLYFFSLKMMLNDFKNGDLQLTGKQKSQLETLMWNTTVNNYANGAYGMKDVLANM